MSIFSRMRTIFISWVYFVDQKAPACFGNSFFYLDKDQEMDAEWVRATKKEITKALEDKLKTKQFEVVILNIQELK